MGEPGVLDAVVEDIHAMLVENVGGPQGGDHVEKCELVFVYEGRGREGSR